ncbi:hypothetical protein ACFVYJ_01450 [Pontibacter sp. JAM-7]|uniref:hypothetical protein n=1 Tax=Pontibacter sp. JAM-7 TaxID=3366581 RepID=UPI003AF73A10
MAISKHMQSTIDTLVSIYLNHLERYVYEAGCHGMGTLGKIIDFQGDPPPPSGMDRSNDKLIDETLKMREEHALFASARYLFGWKHDCNHCGKAYPVVNENGKRILMVPNVCPVCHGNRFILLKGELPESNTLVLLAEGFYARKKLKQHQIADRMGLTERQYEGRLKKGRELMAEEIQRIRRFREAGVMGDEFKAVVGGE